jgi:hypothetical protein
VLWAMDEAPGVPAHLVSTLVAYARYADDDGRGSYPLAATVALRTRKTIWQARRDTAELERLGLLLPGDPGLVKNIRADRRPNVYDLPMSRGNPGATPSEASRGGADATSSEASRGGVGATSSEASRGGIQARTGWHTGPHDLAHMPPRKDLKRSRTSPAPAPAPAPAREPAALIILAAYPSATDDEIETMIKDRIANGARSAAAVLAHETRQGTLRLPCDQDGPGPHSDECRDGDSSRCGMEWCTCRCHTEAAGQ